MNVISQSIVVCWGGWKHERREIAQEIARKNRGWYIAKGIMQRAFEKSSRMKGHRFQVCPQEMHLILFHMLVEGTNQDKDVPIIVLDEFAPSEIRSFSVLMNALPFLILDMRGLSVRASQQESFYTFGDSPSFPLVQDELDVMQDFLDAGVHVLYLNGWDGKKQFVDGVTEFLQIPSGHHSKTARSASFPIWMDILANVAFFKYLTKALQNESDLANQPEQHEQPCQGSGACSSGAWHRPREI